jgi:hypothetical protein
VVLVSTVTETADNRHIDRESLKVLARAVTASNGWGADELSTIDRTGEVDVATRRGDGTLRAARIVWIVRHSDTVYLRSVNGTSAAWYRGVQTRHEGELGAGRLRRDVAFVEAGEHAGDSSGLDDALDAAYRDKYGHSSSALARISAEVARATTLRVDPA